MRSSQEDIDRLAGSMREVKDKVTFCRTCFNIAEGMFCPVCSDAGRDGTVICVVEEIKDLAALERTAEYKGTYPVRGGGLSPRDGVAPEAPRVRELLDRLGGVTEVILAMSPTVEGEATAMYVSGLIKPLGLRVTRIASGLPVGGDLDYADEVTLSRALEGRREV